MLHHTSQHYTTVQHNASCCGTSEHTATHYNINTFQDVLFRARTVNSIHCKSLHNTCNTLQHTSTHCSTRQHTATCCGILQHTATHCNRDTCKDVLFRAGKANSTTYVNDLASEPDVFDLIVCDSNSKQCTLMCYKQGKINRQHTQMILNRHPTFLTLVV